MGNKKILKLKQINHMPTQHQTTLDKCEIQMRYYCEKCEIRDKINEIIDYLNTQPKKEK